MEISCRADKFYLFHMKNTLFLYYAGYINITIFSTHFKPEVILCPSRKIAIETSLFYKLAICLPYFVIGQFLLLTVSVNIRLVVKIVRCLVCQATCQFPQKSMSIFGVYGFTLQGI